MLTPFIRPLFASRLHAAATWRGRVEEVQRAELARMVSMARDTEWGRSHGFRKVRSYEDYRQAVATLTPYEELRPLVMRMIGGEANVLWPGVTRNFAQSSGTSDGRSKYIPVTAESFRRTHYRGARHSVAHYLDNVSGSRLFDGRAFILGGSFANELSLPAGVSVGDLSANLIARMPAMAEWIRVPKRRIALMADWTEKLPALVEASARRTDITNLSGVPSWFLTVLKGVLDHTGAETIHDVWPRLEVFFHGGIAFGPYREQYRRITDPKRMHYLENYNASEGFIAVQNDLSNPAMLMLLDAGQFFEFIPADEALSANPRILAPWEVTKGETYALVLTAVNGLWRYPLGDTVTICDTDPLRITVAGRTKHYINAFGEELMVHNADAALTATCRRLDCDVANYTAAPVYAGSRSRGRHQWLIEFNRAPERLDEFARVLDEEVQRQNSDYQAKRSGGLFLDPLTVTVARRGLFDDWLASTGKLGGQRKVPRLCNDRHFIDPMLQMNQ
ncbi:MAG: GH3 auxin-responsive promoter family protein [Bacteroidales bacterium]|nr:GH3 auxin-responsive promoter family protein [Bacteroidales bacterium]